jgi:hypothetical protein
MVRARRSEMHNLVIREKAGPIRACHNTIKPDLNIFAAILIVIISPWSSFKSKIMLITKGKSFSKIPHLLFTSTGSREMFLLPHALIEIP